MSGAAKQVSADSSSGSVVIELTTPADSVQADTSSGSITLRGGARSVRTEASSGSITLEGLLGTAHMETSSGSISARWTAIPAGSEVFADASSGSVNLSFPAGTILAGNVTVSSGGIHSDFPGVASDRGRHMELTGGTGAVLLRAETSSGGVHLRAH